MKKNGKKGAPFYRFIEISSVTLENMSILCEYLPAFSDNLQNHAYWTVTRFFLCFLSWNGSCAFLYMHCEHLFRRKKSLSAQVSIYESTGSWILTGFLFLPTDPLCRLLYIMVMMRRESCLWFSLPWTAL